MSEVELNNLLHMECIHLLPFMMPMNASMLDHNNTVKIRGMERPFLFNRNTGTVYFTSVLARCFTKIQLILALFCLYLYSSSTALAHSFDSTGTMHVSYTFHTEIYGTTSVRPFTCSLPTSEKVTSLFNHSLPISYLDSTSFWSSMKSAFQTMEPKYMQFEQSTSTIHLDSVLLQVAVENFDCGGNGINRDFQKSLQSDQFPFIDIIPSSLTIQPSELGYIETRVTIRLAGQEQDYQIPVTYTMAKNLEQKVHMGHAKVVLRMSDFGITPPSPFFGLIQVDDELRVEIFFLASIKNLDLP